MTEIALRLAFVLVTATTVVVVTDRWQRRQPRARTTLAQGIAVVVTPACRLCDALHHRLRELHVSYDTVPVDDPRLGSLTFRAAPVLMRIDRHGQVAAMRTGRAAIEQIDEVIGSEGWNEARLA